MRNRVSKSIYILCILLMTALRVSARSEAQQMFLDEAVHDLEWSPDGSLLAVAVDSGVRIYDGEMQPLAHLQANLGAVSQISWQPQQGSQIAVIGFNGVSVEIWDRDTTTETFSLSLSFVLETEYISAIAWSPDGEKLAILVNDFEFGNPDPLGYIEIWNASTWTLGTTISHRLRYAPPMLVWDPTSTMIASGSSACYDPDQCSAGPTLETFDIVSGERAQNTNLGAYPPQSLVWAPGADIAVSTFNVEVYAASGERLYQSEPYNGLRVQLDWSGDGSLLAALDAYGHLAIINPFTAEVLTNSTAIRDVVAIDWNGTTNALAIGSANGVIEMMEMSIILESTSTMTSLNER
ncbi:MAG: hypothetical protein U0694_21670 [Anaerolineae bacterium]